MRKRTQIHIDHNSEFELDLAPLLAVMVKLVPVLLVSSAFVQMMIVETELPQVVQEAIKQEEKKPTTTMQLSIDKEAGFSISVTANGSTESFAIPNDKGQLDYVQLNVKLTELKKQHPETFKIEFQPADNVTYQEIVKAMDEARKSRQSGIKFPVEDKTTGKTAETDFMFPEVTFSNMMEG